MSGWIFRFGRLGADALDGELLDVEGRVGIEHLQAELDGLRVAVLSRDGRRKLLPAATNDKNGAHRGLHRHLKKIVRPIEDQHVRYRMRTARASREAQPP